MFRSLKFVDWGIMAALLIVPRLDSYAGELRAHNYSLCPHTAMDKFALRGWEHAHTSLLIELWWICRPCCGLLREPGFNLS